MTFSSSLLQVRYLGAVYCGLYTICTIYQLPRKERSYYELIKRSIHFVKRVRWLPKVKIDLPLLLHLKLVLVEVLTLIFFTEDLFEDEAIKA